MFLRFRAADAPTVGRELIHDSQRAVDDRQGDNRGDDEYRRGTEPERNESFLALSSTPPGSQIVIVLVVVVLAIFWVPRSEYRRLFASLFYHR